MRDGKDLHTNADAAKTAKKGSKAKGAVSGERSGGAVKPRGKFKHPEKQGVPFRVKLCACQYLCKDSGKRRKEDKEGADLQRGGKSPLYRACQLRGKWLFFNTVTWLYLFFVCFSEEKSQRQTKESGRKERDEKERNTGTGVAKKLSPNHCDEKSGTGVVAKKTEALSLFFADHLFFQKRICKASSYGLATEHSQNKGAATIRANAENQLERAGKQTTDDLSHSGG